MAKSHTVTAVVGGDTIERKVDPVERLILRSDSDMRSWKVTELGRVEIADNLACIIDSDGRGEYRTLGRGRIELGDDRYPLESLTSFLLAEIPPKAEPVPPPRVLRISYGDGRESVDVYSSGATISGTPVGAPADSYETWGARGDDIERVEVVPLEEAATA